MTRYPFLKHVLVCTGGRCNDPARGDERGELIRAELKDLNRELGRKPVVRVCAVSCLDLCDDGPNMVIWPGGDVFSGLDRKKAKEIYLEATRDLE
ncbi:MAG TPA: (2Fe-2S) ferredoxin domain-containing protein [Thermoanaerobaculia bacterium]|nr:(2Fe-2S) ferredoxin domain-containing protein [Thermoanaerobaculia bacterium]